MKKLSKAVLCFLIGGCGCSFVLSNADHMAQFGPDGLKALLGIMVVSLIICGTGFFSLIGWRDDQRSRGPAYAPRPAGAPVSQGARAERGVYALLPGVTYRVMKPFADFYGGLFVAGEELTFVRYSFLPYHGGYTLFFSPRSVFFQEEENSDLLGRLEEYLAPIGNAAADPNAQVFARWQMPYSSTEYLHLEVIANGVRNYLNMPSRLCDYWSFGEVLAGKADATILRDFGAKVVDALKTAVKARQNPP